MVNLICHGKDSHLFINIISNLFNLLNSLIPKVLKCTNHLKEKKKCPPYTGRHVENQPQKKLTLTISLEVNRKLQGVLEETLLKDNITLNLRQIQGLHPIPM